MRGGLRGLLLAWICTCLVLTRITHASNVRDDNYQLPLISPYVVSHENGQISIVRKFNSSEFGAGNLDIFHTVVEHVDQLAMSGKNIVGVAKGGNFIINTQQQDAEPQLFSTYQQWQSGLAAAGIPENIQLATPDSLTANISDRILRPWNYRVMKGRFGQSDDAWSLIVQLLGFALTFLLGCLNPKKFLRGDAVLIGLAINIIAQIVIAGEGPGAFAGFVGLPLMCCIAGYFGSQARKIINPARSQNITTA